MGQQSSRERPPPFGECEVKADMPDVLVTEGTQIHDITAGGDIHAQNIQSTVNHTTNFFQRRQIVKSFSTVHAPTDLFQGRLEMLEVIHAKLQSGPNSVAQKLALVGYGGMGKSELARKLVVNYKRDYPSAAWLEAETEEGLKESFSSLAKLLGLNTGSNESGKEIAKKVFRHVGKHIPSALFIYDNANRLESEEGTFGILDYLPKEIYDHPPLIFITSRTAEWTRNNIIETVKVTEPVSRAPR